MVDPVRYVDTLHAADHLAFHIGQIALNHPQGRDQPEPAPRAEQYVPRARSQMTFSREREVPRSKLVLCATEGSRRLSKLAKLNPYLPLPGDGRG